MGRLNESEVIAYGRQIFKNIKSNISFIYWAYGTINVEGVKIVKLVAGPHKLCVSEAPTGVIAHLQKIHNYGKIKKDSNFQNDIVSSFFGAAL